MVRWQDEAVRIPGTNQRIGFDAVVGFLFPGAGDLVSGLLSLLVVVVAARRGVPPRSLLFMVLNVLLDVLIGFVPVVGDLFDVGFKASSKNLALLETELDVERPKATSVWPLVAAGALVVFSLLSTCLLGWLAFRWIGGLLAERW